MRALCQDERFIQYGKAFSDGLMNLDFFYDIAETEFPFDFDTACNELEDKDYFIVLTDSQDGSTHYLEPTRENWIDMTIAASTVPMLTKGKHKVNYVPHMDNGDCVVVVNAEKIVVSGNKEEQKTYFRHTGYAGGVKTSSLAHLRRTYPERIIEKAVKGMLPSNKLGRRMYSHLKVYSGPKHPHQAQSPKILEI